MLQPLYETYFREHGRQNELGLYVIGQSREETAWNNDYDVGGDFTYTVQLAYTTEGIFNLTGNYLCTWEDLSTIQSLSHVMNLPASTQLPRILNLLVEDYSIID